MLIFLQIFETVSNSLTDKPGQPRSKSKFTIVSKITIFNISNPGKARVD